MTIAVRHFTSAEALKEHYKALFAPKTPIVPVERCRPSEAAKLAQEIEERAPEPMPAEIALLLARFREVHLGERQDVEPSDDPVRAFPAGVMMKAILMEVVEEFRIHPLDIKSERRGHNLVLARQALMYLLRTYTCKSFPEIGRFIGGRDHTTVLHGVRKCEERMAKDSTYRLKVQTIERRLGVLA